MKLPVFAQRYYLFTVFFAILILLASLYRGAPGSQIQFIPHLDKYLHGVSYFVFTLILLKEMTFHRKGLNAFVFFFVFLLLFSYGALMELLQLWLTNYRTASVVDALINGAGILAGLITRMLIK